MTTTETAPAAIDRSKSLGGHDVAAIMGLSPFATPLDVWRAKVLGQQDDVDTPATRCGKRFELPLLREYAARHPDASTIVWTRSPLIVDGYRRATPDAVAEQAGFFEIVEGKTTRMTQNWGEDGGDGIPLDYVVQGTWYADIIGADTIAYPVILWPFDMRDLLGRTAEEIVGMVDVRVMRIQFSATLAKVAREMAHAFWHEHVLKETPPPAVDLADIKRLVRTVRDKERVADEEFIELMRERERLAAEQRVLDKAQERNEFALRQWMGDAEVAVGGNGWPLLTARPINVKASVREVAAYSYRPLKTTKHWNKP